MAAKTILLKGNPARDEAQANATLTPGHVIELISTGKVRKLDAGALNNPMMVALENSLQGNEIGTDYSADDMVQYGVFKSGEEVYLWLSDGQNVAIGAQLEYGSTDGEMIARSAGIAKATALEAVDLSQSANLTAAGRIKCLVN